MINEKYMDLINVLKSFNESTEKLFFDCEDSCTLEENRANSIIEYLTTEIDEAIHELEHLNKKTKEGILLLNSQGRFNLDIMPELYFTCGDIIEVNVDNTWQRGRIEHDNKDYYFCNYDGNNVNLVEGLKARIRVDA